MARLYFDEDPDRRIARELRALGHDVLTALEDGRANQGIPDEDVRRRATELQRTVVTCNRPDYKRLHRSTHGAHAGVITVSQIGEPIAMARRLHARLEDLGPLDGQIVHVYCGG